MNEEISLFGHSGSALAAPVWRDFIATARPEPLTAAQIWSWRAFIEQLEPDLATVARLARGGASENFAPATWARLCAWWALLWNPSVDPFEPLGCGKHLHFTDRLAAASAPGMAESLSGGLRRAVVRLLVALLTETRAIHKGRVQAEHSRDNAAAIACYQELLVRLLPPGPTGADGMTIWLALLGTGRPAFDSDEPLSLTSLLDWILQEAEISTFWLIQADRALRRQIAETRHVDETVSWYLERMLEALRGREGRYSAELLAGQMAAIYGEYYAFAKLTATEVALLLDGLGPRCASEQLRMLLASIFHGADTLVTKQLAISDETDLAAIAEVRAAVQRAEPTEAERYLAIIARIMDDGATAVEDARKQADKAARLREAAWASLAEAI